MICTDCKANKHGECRGGTWCACQHRVPPVPLPQEEPKAAEPAVRTSMLSRYVRRPFRTHGGQ